MNLSFFRGVQEKTQKEKAISVKAYAVKKSDLLIIVGFPGSEHNARIMNNFEMKIREYLHKNLTKKMVSRKGGHTGSLPSGQGSLKGNGKLDRTYHGEEQFHFYRGNNSEEIEEAIKNLRKYGLNFSSELPTYLISDLEQIV